MVFSPRNVKGEEAQCRDEAAVIPRLRSEAATIVGF